MNIQQLKSTLPVGTTILGFDYGDKRLGVAVSDLLLMTANPVGIIQRSSIEKDTLQIQEIIRDRNVGALVYGLPLQMDGTEGETAAKVRKFAEDLNKKIPLPYLFWDERLSSRAVESFLIKEVDMSRAKRKKVLDSGAAAYILQGVLDSLQYA
jgi:putative Holliday junction resolvase